MKNLFCLNNIPFIIYFLGLAILVVLLIGVMIFFFSFNKAGKKFELKSTYECGFLPFYEVQLNFNVNFYIISILFIIFDIEIVFLFPWAAIYSSFTLKDFAAVVVFFLFLVIGLFFELRLEVLHL